MLRLTLLYETGRAHEIDCECGVSPPKDNTIAPCSKFRLCNFNKLPARDESKSKYRELHENAVRCVLTSNTKLLCNWRAVEKPMKHQGTPVRCQLLKVGKIREYSTDGVPTDNALEHGTVSLFVRVRYVLVTVL